MFVLWLVVTHAAVIAGQDLSLHLHLHFSHTLSLFFILLFLKFSLQFVTGLL